MERIWPAAVIALFRLSGECDAPALAPPLQIADHGLADSGEETVHARRIVDDISAVERWAEHRGLGHLAAIAAADAGIVEGSDWIVFERIVGVLDRKRRAAG